ncbi:MAG: 3-methyl-2-oxobutanoate dehydrogenase subunit beta, partial [Planctomycetes bacterium]|nr:3-methyl-2-oxobutanoate dehydrogenase subunit beta [Planctomycetota bacterium]
ALALPPKDWALQGSRGRKQNVIRSLWLGDGALEALNMDLQARYERIAQEEVLYESYGLQDADIVLVAYGIAARISRSAVDRARKQGLAVGMLRPITLWPFPSQTISTLAREGRSFLTVEMSCGQMLDDVNLAVAGKTSVGFHGRSGGSIPSVDDILSQITTMAQMSSGKGAVA